MSEHIVSEHKATITWKRTSESFDYDLYNREHEWRFESGQTLNAAAAPAFKGSPDCVDPEEAFVAAVASCHMLTFLALCAKKRIPVDSYQDDAVGILDKNEEGKLAMTRVTLRPKIKFGDGQEPEAEKIAQLHDRAHANCFIALSVKTGITVE